MKKYVVRFTVALLICIFLFNFLIDKEYKNIYANDNGNIEIKTLEQFIKEFSVIPEEIKEAYYEDFQLYDIPLSQELQEYTFEICKKYKIDYVFVLSVMQTESEFKSYDKCKNQVGGGYSVGLLQINDQYIDWYKELINVEDYDIYDDKQNIETGVAILRCYKNYWIKQEITDEDTLWCYVLNSYNMGIEGYKNYIKNTSEISRDYDKKTLKNKIKLEIDGGIE
jgi:hypothetical protein